MKWIVLLALVVSCTTSKEIPTESDAKPVSPYTVEPCYCMKIYKPVCAGGQNYGNSCEAECDGHQTWTDGPCQK